MRSSTLKKLFILYFGSISLFISCNKNTPTEPETNSGLSNTRSVNGKIVLPPLLKKISSQDLDIISYHEKDDINFDNTFDIDVYDSDSPQMVFAVNSNENMVLGATVFGHTENIIIDEYSTASTFILLNPLFLFSDNDQKNEINTKAKSCPSYIKLVELVKKIIHTDLENMYNVKKYPELLTISNDIATELLGKEGSSKSLSGNLIANSYESGKVPSCIIDGSNKGSVEFTNPNFVAIAGDAIDLDTYRLFNSFMFEPIPSLISFRLALPPTYITQPTSTKLKFSAAKKFTIRSTKGFDTDKPMREWFDNNHLHGRASLANMGIVAEQIIKLAVGGLVLKSVKFAAHDVNINFDETKAHFYLFLNAKAEKNSIKAATELMNIIMVNWKEFAGALGAMGGQLIISTLMEITNGYWAIVKWSGRLYQFLNETMPIISDLTSGSRWFNYRIETDQNGNVIRAEYVGDGKPEVPYVRGKYFRLIHSIFNIDHYVTVNSISATNQYKKIKYNIQIQPHFFFQHLLIYETKFYDIGTTEVINLGDFKTTAEDNSLRIQAEDEDGNTSEFSRWIDANDSIWW